MFCQGQKECWKMGVSPSNDVVEAHVHESIPVVNDAGDWNNLMQKHRCKLWKW